MESGTIGYSGKLLCLPVRKGTVGHIIEHNAAIMGGHMFVQCLFCALLGAFVIYAFDLHIFRRQEAYRSMKIKELYIGSEKGCPPLRVSSMELIKGVGPKGEAHGKHQAGLWSTADRMLLEPIKEQALCAKRFFANIIIDCFDIPLNGGDILHAGSAVMQISHEGKRCFGEECELFCSGTPCPLHSCRYLTIESGGIIAENDLITKEDRP